MAFTNRMKSQFNDWPDYGTNWCPRLKEGGCVEVEAGGRLRCLFDLTLGNGSAISDRNKAGAVSIWSASFVVAILACFYSWTKLGYEVPEVAKMASLVNWIGHLGYVALSTSLENI